MLPLVSNDAVAILFMFDLTRKTTLNSVKEWYRQARGFNKVTTYEDELTVDGDTSPDWHKVRLLRVLTSGRARGDYKAGKAIFQGDARASGEFESSHVLIKDFLLDIPFHQRAKDLQDCPGQSIRPEGGSCLGRAYFSVLYPK